MSDLMLPDTSDAKLLLLHAERIVVGRRSVVGDTVRVERSTTVADHAVSAGLAIDDVQISHVPIGRFVDVAPLVRTEDGVTIIPVMEEVAVTQIRLRLKEEIHVRRTAGSRMHVETVTLREQQARATRIPVNGVPGSAPSIARAAVPLPNQSHKDDKTMDNETIVAVFDNAADADAAVHDLTAMGIPSTDISRTGSAGTTYGIETAPVKEEGFWARLFGSEPHGESAVYDRSVAAGSIVVTVKVGEAHATRAMDILEGYNPVDIDERATSYGYTSGTATAPAAYGAGYSETTAPVAYDTMPAVGTATATGDTIKLAEERLSVGKRVVNLGGTRIRRFVVETPVEEQVSLHSEKVVLERRPVTDGRPVTDADFSDKTIEMTEMAEEAVVAKQAFVTEEISLRKEATDRVETIRDTVRREDVEIEQIPGETVRTTR